MLFKFDFKRFKSSTEKCCTPLNTSTSGICRKQDAALCSCFKCARAWNRAESGRQVQSSATREEIASVSVFTSAIIVVSAQRDRPCLNYRGNLSPGRPATAAHDKSVTCRCAMGSVPIFRENPVTELSHIGDSVCVRGDNNIGPGHAAASQTPAHCAGTLAGG